ncbi:hypothetical protein LBMAG49_00130 [Planctomycetota bacterium]|nr:DUF2071 domain-containing protein [Planctomycetota bacterium]MSR39116.1 DUF2071 domain-containing protein [Planctomycetota bacterium]GDY00684.1 hypothetical protein LBMAG49_00130 [Planctomycetota bacterium]
MMHPALRVTSHRSEPLPKHAWRLSMDWDDLVMMHWPADGAVLQRLLPNGLEIEEREGSAWLGVVPFMMRRVRSRWLPPIPFTNAFPELNLRTYVRHRGKPGIWFFSLDAASLLAVRSARAAFSLPYFDARMRCERRGNDVHYQSERTDRRAMAARLDVRWTMPTSFAPPAVGSMPHWFVERYRMFLSQRGRIRTGHVAHPPWQLAEVDVQIEQCDMTRICGLKLTGKPAFTHAAARQTVVGFLPSDD